MEVLQKDDQRERSSSMANNEPSSNGNEREEDQVSPSSSSSSPKSKQDRRQEKHDRRRRRNHEIWLHIYDLDPVTAHLNDMMLRGAGMGAFHCGVEVLAEEWFFAFGDSDCTGVLCNEPKGHQVHVYKESIHMGQSPLTETEVRTVLSEAMDDWPANSYHPVSRSCVNFAEDLLLRLKVPEPFPVWARGAADTGKNAYLYPVVDWSWNWVKWYYSETPSQDTLQQGGPAASSAGGPSSLAAPTGQKDS